MTSPITSPAAAATLTDALPTSKATLSPTDLLLGESWHSRIEAQVRDGVRELIESLLQAELDAALGRQRYKRLNPAHPQRRSPRRALQSLAMRCQRRRLARPRAIATEPALA